MKPRGLVLIGCSLLLLALIWFAASGNRNEPSSISSAAAPQKPGASSDLAANRRPATVSSGTTTFRNVAGATPSSSLPVATKVTSLPWVSAGGGPSNPARADAPPLPVLPPPTGKTAEAWVDLDKANRMLRDYRTLMGENPVGTNAEIMKAIMGHNPKGATLGPPDGMSLNGSGELVDPWGTPLFFHQISGTHMEIWSAGPDGKIGTSDDLMLK